VTGKGAKATMIVLGALGTVVAGVVALALLSRSDPGRERSPTAAQLSQSLGDVVAPLELAPFGNRPVAPAAVKVKSDPAYYVATGVASLPEETARHDVVRTLERQGWTLVRQGDVAHFLGWEALAVRGPMVLLASVGAEAAGIPDTPYRRHAGHSYVQLAVAGRDAGPAWSRVGR
jgi:hypothetical protein